MATKTTNYLIRRLSDASSVGAIRLTAEQFAKYERISQQPEGAIVLAELMDEVCAGSNQYDEIDFAHEDQDTSIAVWLE